MVQPIHIITPVKDSIASTLETARAVLASRLDAPHSYTLYNDFSTPENTLALEAAQREMGFTLTNLSELTSHPSPNYLFVLRRERERCLREGAALLIVESDVTVRPDTLQALADAARLRPDAGLVAAATCDEEGRINYPYLFVKNKRDEVIDTRRHCSFCCTLLTTALLQKVDFGALDDGKNWFDVTISHLALAAGLHNYILTRSTALHRPHASRPWKVLKYQNPLKYYWLKLTRGMDKI